MSKAIDCKLEAWHQEKLAADEQKKKELYQLNQRRRFIKYSLRSYYLELPQIQRKKAPLKLKKLFKALLLLVIVRKF